MLLRHQLVFLLCLSLTGCSTFGFVFERLDWLTLWQLDRMFDLNDEQEQTLEPKAKDLQNWLRVEGFPKLITELNQVVTLWDANQLPQAIDHMESASLVLGKEALNAAMPLLTTLAESFSPNNAKHYRQYIKEKQTDWFAYAESNETKIAFRIDRLEDWFGDLTDAQVVIASRWSMLQPNEQQIRLDNNQQWTEKLIETALAKDIDQLRHWLQNPEVLWSKAYQQLYDTNYANVQSMMDALLPTLSEAQKKHARKRVNDWIKNLQEVSQ
jgi:hypothetical protein